MITAFKGEYRFLSNFYPAPVTLDGITYPTVEHAYQASKTADPKERRTILNTSSPGKAKQLGKTVTLQPGFDKDKITIMTNLVQQKFTPGTQLAEKLKETGHLDIIEGNHWNDTFWGICKGRGSNHLGNILKNTRAELQNEKHSPSPAQNHNTCENNRHTLIYAGIGSRQTPENIAQDMFNIARTLADQGWSLRSGGATGADAAFNKGASYTTKTGDNPYEPRKEIIIPWNNFNHLKAGDPGICLPLDKFHIKYAKRAQSIEPWYKHCGGYVKTLKERNIAIIEGLELNKPVDAVICWTPQGQIAGGTALGIRHAKMLNIPVFNLFDRSRDTVLATMNKIKNNKQKARAQDHEQSL